MLQTSLLLMKSLKKTNKKKKNNSHFLICSVFFVSKGNLFDVYFICGVWFVIFVSFLLLLVPLGKAVLRVCCISWVKSHIFATTYIGSICNTLYLECLDSWDFLPGSLGFGLFLIVCTKMWRAPSPIGVSTFSPD